MARLSCSSCEYLLSAFSVFFSRSCNVWMRSEEHTSELQSHLNLVCRLLLEKKKKFHVDAIEKTSDVSLVNYLCVWVLRVATRALAVTARPETHQHLYDDV